MFNCGSVPQWNEVCWVNLLDESPLGYVARRRIVKVTAVVINDVLLLIFGDDLQGGEHADQMYEGLEQFEQDVDNCSISVDWAGGSRIVSHTAESTKFLGSSSSLRAGLTDEVKEAIRQVLLGMA